MRAPVDTWTIASTTAADANHALAAIVDEKTAVTMLVYVELALKRTCIEAERHYWIRSPRVQTLGRPARPPTRRLRDDLCAREVAPGHARPPEDLGELGRARRPVPRRDGVPGELR